MKKNIAILIRALRIGGAEKQSLLLAQALQKEYNVYYFVQISKSPVQKYVDFIKEKNINCIQLHGGFIARAIMLRRQIKKYNIELVFAYLPSDNLLAAFSSFYSRYIVIGGIRSSLLALHKKLTIRFLDKFFFTSLVYNNHSGRNAFTCNGFSKEKSVVIPNFITINEKETIREEKDEITILSVGRYTKPKDYHTAIYAIFYLTEHLKIPVNFKYQIIGYGKLENQMREWIDKYNLKNVEMVIAPDNLENYYRHADIYLCSSLYEGFSNSIMEALNFCLPVVATNVGDNKFIVTHNYNGYLVEKCQPVQIAEKLNILLLDHKKRLAFGKAGYELLRRNYSNDTVKKEYISLIERNLNN